MLVPKLEKSLGIEVYATSCPGIGGVIRQNVEDFIVQEMLVDGSRAEIVRSEGSAERSVLGSSSIKNRYLLCILVKRNWDTFMALRNISQRVGISPTRIQIAGIKDAKAVTAQHITIENTSKEDVKNFKLKDIEVHPIGYVRTKLSPYYLQGNSFHITIKKIRHSKTTIRKRVLETADELEALGGIPNFFGHQRFGTVRPVTHLVGKAIVMRNLKKAAMMFLAKPSLLEHPLSRQVRQELRSTGNFKQAFKIFPKQLRYERSMLRSLAEKPDDFSTAFKRVPVRLQRIFVQAYQSYLFNRFLSGRIKLGLSLTAAQAGDYVTYIERSGLPMSTMYKVADSENLAELNKAIKDGKMRLALPLIGLKQTPSQGVQGDIEHEILREEGISGHDFKVAGMPEMSSKGQLRAMITHVRDFYIQDITDDSVSLGRNILKIAFRLYRGSYATIVLRELMKTRRPIEAGF